MDCFSSPQESIQHKYQTIRDELTSEFYNPQTFSSHFRVDLLGGLIKRAVCEFTAVIYHDRALINQTGRRAYPSLYRHRWLYGMHIQTDIQWLADGRGPEPYAFIPPVSIETHRPEWQIWMALGFSETAVS